MSAQPATYDRDVIAWAQEQAKLLRAGKFDQLDIEHIADEVEDVGKSEERELASRMAVLLAHLLKWQFQAAKRGASWQVTIKIQRKAITNRLRKTPSLKSSLNEADWQEDVWADAIVLAAKETGKGVDTFPDICPWSTEEILSPAFFPEN